MKTAVIAIFFVVCTTSQCKSGSNSTDDSTFKDLKLEKKLSLNSLELSGLATTGKTSEHPTMFTISDESTEIFEISNNLEDVAKHDVIIQNCPDIGRPSQFEAIAADKNYFFVLQESRSRIFIITRETYRCERVISFVVPENLAMSHDWNSDSNSLGEGMILLKNGHMILAKEKAPVLLIEFAPPGVQAQGFRPGDGITWQDEFPFNTTSTDPYYAVKFWKMSDKSEFKLSDISELALAPDGVIYALSDQKNGLGKLESVLSPGEKSFKVKNFWSFPNKIRKAEGLVIDEDYSTYVAADTALDQKNFFIFRRLIQ